MKTVVKSRPAEASGGTLALAAVIARVAGVDADTALAAAVAAGLVPSAVTLLVTHGGVRGAWRALIYGRAA